MSMAWDKAENYKLEFSILNEICLVFAYSICDDDDENCSCVSVSSVAWAAR